MRAFAVKAKLAGLMGCGQLLDYEPAEQLGQLRAK
jgi:hypothetical protein